MLYRRLYYELQSISGNKTELNYNGYEIKISVNISLKDDKLKSGEEYTIAIEKMYGLSKADAPLHITGTWECKFIK